SSAYHDTPTPPTYPLSLPDALPIYTRHVRIDHPPARVVAVSPDPIHQLVAAEHDPRIPREREQDLELEGRELDLVPVDGHPAARSEEHTSELPSLPTLLSPLLPATP